ncbi:MAG: L-histidine N(alpha)-methyltransferase [Acidobacteriota bacterium]
MTTATAPPTKPEDAAAERLRGGDAMLREVTEGLLAPQKQIHCKYLYDQRGSELFERICGLDAYYPTRTEISILERRGDEMADRIGPRALLIEPGAGSSLKTRLLLDRLRRPVAYVPVDISGAHLEIHATSLRRSYPDLGILPVCADYTGPFEVPIPEIPPRRRVVFFPGSTIGNFTADAVIPFLRTLATTAGPGGGLLIGVDLRKDPAILERAYNDEEGVTAEFNLNLLRHLDRKLGSDFGTEGFRHVAFWNDAESRIEMYLESLERRTVHLGDIAIHLGLGERILTEYSHKFTVDGFGRLAAEAGLELEQTWTDPRRWFSIHHLSI